MILICYDGSADAQAAVERAGQLMPGQPTMILTVWETYVDVISRTVAGMLYWPEQAQMDEIDRAAEQSAQQRAEEGTERARAAGLDARARTCARARGETTAQTILEEARALDAAAIVLGTRGLTGVKSLLLGSVSHGVVQHADRPVVVVPSAEVAARRAAGGH